MKHEVKPDLKPHGGAGRSQGRKTKDGAKHLVSASFSLTRDHILLTQKHGGSQWIRNLIDKEQARLFLEEQAEARREATTIKASFGTFKLPEKLNCNPDFKSNPDDPF